MLWKHGGIADWNIFVALSALVHKFLEDAGREHDCAAVCPSHATVNDKRKNVDVGCDCTDLQKGKKCRISVGSQRVRVRSWRGWELRHGKDCVPVVVCVARGAKDGASDGPLPCQMRRRPRQFYPSFCLSEGGNIT